MSLDHLDLDGEGFWYLASPYTRQPDGIERAAQAAARMAGWLASLGVDAYCPIAESHFIAMHSGIDPMDTELWMARNQPFIKAAHGLLVILMVGWEESYGVQAEIRAFERAGKPVWYLEPRRGVHKDEEL